MLPIWFLYIAAGIRIAGGLAYLKATISGKAKPNPVSWLLWGAMPITAFFVGLSAGVGIEAIVTLALGVSPILVFAAVMIKNPRSLRLQGLNLVCVVIALIGIVFWLTTKTPEMALACLLLADLASALPTVRKSVKNPESEFAPTYLISAIGMTIALMTMTDLSFMAVAYPTYTLVINLLMFSLISQGKLKATTSRRHHRHRRHRQKSHHRLIRSRKNKSRR